MNEKELIKKLNKTPDYRFIGEVSNKGAKIYLDRMSDLKTLKTTTQVLRGLLDELQKIHGYNKGLKIYQAALFQIDDLGI